MDKLLRLTRPCYTMEVEGKSGEITMYGEIVETHPVDGWTGQPVEGEFIVLQDFLADLDSLKELDELTIHMNSVGGDAGASIAIHNRLRQLRAHKTCIVEGVAMSGGSLIMCACDHISVYPSSIVLMHHAWSYVFGAYNAPELNKLADQLVGIDKSQAEIYMRKTQKSMDEIISIMDEERYRTGREAYEDGLVDELIEDDDDEPDIEASADRRTLFVRGHRIAAMGTLPDSIKTVKTAPGSGRDKSPENSGRTREGGHTMTIDEFRAENPELAEALLAEARASANAEAANAERKRLEDIDAIASLFDNETVNEAKYGENACTAQEMAYRAAIRSAEQGKQFMANVAEDYNESGASDVSPANTSMDMNTQMSNADLVAAGKAAAMKAQGKEA